MNPTPTEAVEAARRVEEFLLRCLPISEDDHQAAHDFANAIGDDALLVARAFLIACEALEKIVNNTRDFSVDTCPKNTLRDIHGIAVRALSCPAPPSNSGGGGVTKL